MSATRPSAEVKPPELSVIVFAFNEAENVAAVLGELRAWMERFEPYAEIVFVDDGSSDKTSVEAAVALSGCRHVMRKHETNKGIGAALKTGVAASSADFVTFMPADGQIEPAAIGTLRAEQGSTGAELVLSLYADRDDGLSRKVLSFGMRALVLAIHGVKLESDGPYLFRRALFEPGKMPSDSFFLNLEFPIRVLLTKVKTSTVVIRCRPRRAGASKSAKAKVVARVAKELVAFRVRRVLE